ncbi:MAG TPA: zinc ABC transporter substrate-binding protein [Acidimicrobiales bacterium]|jgi:zinc/manganese transport system substrate-binding protein|nr:zinc ABC transporter substrate-binding protein [Acidimicrobiales bacterium]
MGIPGFSGPRRRALVPAAPFTVPLVAALLLATGCGSSRAAGSSTTSVGTGGKVLQVVVAENDWGSIAAQVGGKFVHVTSIITDPNADPHTYEPTPADGRTVATADLVWYNGIGYDNWMPKLLAADPGNRTVLSVGQVVGVADGGNPHRWYNPADVQTVIKSYVADLSKLDPASGSYFQSQATTYNAMGLKAYNDEIALIKSKYSGVPVGASESIFAMLSPALGLSLITPPSFLKAISEGTDVSAADKTTIDNQIKNHLIKVYVYNSQNSTPDVQTQVKEAQDAHIPTATITETLVPPTATYQDWQTTQLNGIAAALATATGR